MLLAEDMRGWILICSQYHMNCYHTCLSFSLQIFSYVSLVVCLGGTLNHTVWLDCSVKFLFHAIFSLNEKICLHHFLASANHNKQKNLQSVILMWLAATHLLFRKSVTTTR